MNLFVNTGAVLLALATGLSSAELLPVDLEKAAAESEAASALSFSARTGSSFEDPQAWLGATALGLPQGELEKLLTLRLRDFPQGFPAPAGAPGKSSSRRSGAGQAAFGVALEANFQRSGWLRWLAKVGWEHQDLQGGDRTLEYSNGDFASYAVQAKMDAYPLMLGLRLLAPGTGFSPYLAAGMALVQVQVPETWIYASPSRPGLQRHHSSQASYEAWTTVVSAGFDWWWQWGPWRLQMAFGGQLGRASELTATEEADKNGDGARDVAKGQPLLFPGAASGPWVELTGIEGRLGLGFEF